jgi:hypothetical protein
MAGKMTTSAQQILEKYAAGMTGSEYLYAAREIANLSYEELGPRVVQATTRLQKPEDVMAGMARCALIASALGATNIKHGVTQKSLDRLRGRRSDQYAGYRGVDDRDGLAAIFDHAMTFQEGRHVVGILTRPYASSLVTQAADQLLRDAEVELWAQPSALCSWYPGSTRSYLLTKPGAANPGFGFARLGR